MKQSLKWINIIAFIVMMTVNIIAELLPLGGSTTGEISASFPSLFTPSPITFSIWGLIYAMMAAFILFQCGIFDHNTISTVIRNKIGIWFAISSILNSGWLISWHMKEIEISVIFMVGLLISLIFITRGISDVIEKSIGKFIVSAGFDIYFGWIIVATIANISIMLVKLNWNRFGISEQVITVIVLLVGALIASGVVLIDNRWISGIAIIWAYFGIVIKHTAQSGYNLRYPSIVITSFICIAVIIGAIVGKALCYRKESFV